MTEVNQLCRLCLSNENLVDVFDERLTTADQLMLCVLLCTGIEIKTTDDVSKLICQRCCSLAIELYKFRETAIASDKSLKNLLNQDSDTIPLCKETIQHLNESVLQKLAEEILTNFPFESEINTKEDETPKPILIDAATETEVIENVEKETSCKTVETLKIRIPKHMLSTNIVESASSSDNEMEEDDNRVSDNQRSLESDDDDTPIATLKRKYRSVRAHKMFKSRFYSESESDSEPISKRNKFNKYYVDDDYTENESENEEGIQEDYEERRRTEWRRSRPQRQKTQTQQEIDSDVSAEKQNVEQKNSEPYSKYCEYCDRYFWGNSQLKAHQRVHFRCGFCTKGFESHEVLQEHLVSVCYNSIINQKVIIPLVRVDEDVKLIRTHQLVFDKYFQDIADGVYDNPELAKNPSAKHRLYHTRANNKVEKYEISKIFIKFRHLDNSPVHKNLSIQTKRLQTDTSNPNLSNVVLDDGYKDLQLFNIPIQFVVDKLQSAYISFAKPPKDTNVRDLWPPCNAKKIVDKFKTNYPSLSNKTLDQNNLQNSINSMLPPIVPVNIGVRKPMYRVVAADGLQPQIRQNFTIDSFGNINDSVRAAPNILRKPFNPPFDVNSYKTIQKPSVGTVPNVSNVPNLKIKYIATHASNPPKNNIVGTNTKNNSDETDSQKPSNPIILNVLLNEKSNNLRKESNMSQTELNARRIIRRTYNRKPPNPNPLETSNITKSVCDNFKIHVLKQPPTQAELNASKSVTQETIHAKQNSPLQNNLEVNYPPRPNTAIQNMLQNISNEISIEPNYRKHNQTTGNTLNTHNNGKTDSTPPNNTNNFSKPSSNSGKPKAYPRPIPIKEEEQIEEEEYIPDQQQLSNDDFSTGFQIKEEHELEEHNYSQLGVNEDPICTPNLYQPPVQSNMSYPQQHPVRYHNIPQQYYKPMDQATNLPRMRSRFVPIQPYRPVQYRGRSQMAMYQTRVNQSVSNIINPPIPSNTLVQSNTFTNNFLPNNVYPRSYGNNYNNCNNYNMYQTSSYQNQYSSYNSQTQPTIDFNSPYQSEHMSQDTETKHLPAKQPWEMFR